MNTILYYHPLLTIPIDVVENTTSEKWNGYFYSSMKKLLNILLLLTFQMGYLQWGHSNSSFIFMSEAALFSKASTDPGSFLHPIVLILLCGQLILLYTIFQKQPGRVLSLTGLACLSVLMLFLLFIGIISFNIKIIGSTLPFIITGVLALKYHRKATPTV